MMYRDESAKVCEAAPTRQGEVRQALEHLGERVGMVKETISQLESRLILVLGARPAVPTEVSTQKTRPVEVPYLTRLALELFKLTESLTDSVDYLKALVTRIEL